MMIRNGGLHRGGRDGNGGKIWSLNRCGLWVGHGQIFLRAVGGGGLVCAFGESLGDVGDGVFGLVFLGG